MLDQNTDRMWYVIGAVLIGAAIIFGMSILMPEAFASVSNNFDAVTTTVSSRLYENNKPKSFNQTNQFNIDTVVKRYHIFTHSGETNKNEEWSHSDYIPINANTSYDFQTESRSINKRILFYDSDKNYISGYGGQGSAGSIGALKLDYRIRTTSPTNARFTRIATVYNNKAGRDDGFSPLHEWWFGYSADNPF